MLVGGQNDGGAAVDQGIERVQELVLRGACTRQEMNVVHGQRPEPAVPGTKAAQRAGSHRFQEAVGERLSRDREDIQTGVNRRRPWVIASRRWVLPRPTPP